ncbi:MAG: SUF system NifU family Fe-S cluster assembly protein [Armatimonadota bacterium]|nr:SUF system NifU family Fe-S cluster assembly protein [Armatimonadota bacterium]
MSELSELYQEVILDHNKSPRNFGKLQSANVVKEGFNPLCGDHLHIYLRLENDVIQDIKFEGHGCAISKASASIMTTMLKGKTKAEAETLFEQFHDLVTADMDTLPDLDSLGRLAVFAGVREFPARVKCASLAWHTVHAALEGDAKVVSTE